MEYIKNIALFLVFVSFLENVIQMPQMKKYVRLFCGIILIIIILEPIMEIFNLKEFMIKSIDSNELSYRLSEAENMMSKNDEYIYDKTMEVYTEIIDDDIEEKIGREGLYAGEIDFVINKEDGSMDSITLEISKEEVSAGAIKVDKIHIGDKNQNVIVDTPEIINIKDYINNVYGVEYEKIYIKYD